jgi:hypothetical protein
MTDAAASAALLFAAIGNPQKISYPSKRKWMRSGHVLWGLLGQFAPASPIACPKRLGGANQLSDANISTANNAASLQVHF